MPTHNFLRFLIGTIVFLSFHRLSAQMYPANAKPQIDSLNRVVATAKYDSVKAAALLQMANLYLQKNPDTSVIICKRAEEISRRSNFQDGISSCYSIYGYVLIDKGELEKGLNYFKMALPVNRKLGDKNGEASNYSNIASVYVTMGNFQLALDYYYKSLALSEEMGNKKEIVNTMSNIGIILSNQKEWDKALRNYEKCLALSRKNGFEDLVAKSLGDIGTIYRTKANQLIERHGPKDSILLYRNKALGNFTEALDMNRKMDNTPGERRSLAAIGITYMHWLGFMVEQNFAKDSITKTGDLALTYFAKSLEISIASGAKQSIAYNLEYIGNINLLKGNLAEAEKYATQSWQLSTEIGTPANIKQVSRLLYKIYKEKQDYKNALAMYEKYIAVRDSITNEESQKAILKKEFEFENAKKEQENLALNQKNEIQQLELSRKQYMIYAMVAVLLLVICLSFLLIRQMKILNRQKTMKLEQRLLRSQMNPHFIFNSLTAIQNFIYKNDTKASGKYLSSFAKLVRAILENSREEYITLTKEIQWLENYFNLQQLRFDHNFDYKITVDPDIDTSSTLIPPMLTQPSIENALEHGLKNIDYKGLVEVEFRMENNYLVVRVKDNGVGISESTIPVNTGVDEHVSLATTITKERLRLLNRRRFRKIIFHIDSIKSSGTLITFSIPLQMR